ncbi:MAG: acetyltransferase [Pseudomonadota bacterium]|nr:acetyltransferase [Pseudomonadota bacterium]
MKSLLLVGGGGHCHSCIDVIEATEIYQIKGLVQPELSSELILGYPIIGSDEDLPILLKDIKSALVTVGQIRNPEIRIRLFDLLKQLGAELPVIISPRAYCSKHAVLGEGLIVMHGAIINSAACIGNNCIINSQALIEHDVEIDDHCHISTGARVNGNVTIGKRSFVGSGAVVKEGINIGENVIIGAGQVISQDVSSGTVVKHDE